MTARTVAVDVTKEGSAPFVLLPASEFELPESTLANGLGGSW
jgi:hypothetical protein